MDASQNHRSLLAVALGLLLVPAAHAQRKDPLHFGEKVPSGCVAILDGTTVTEERMIAEMMRAMGRPGQEGDAARKSLAEETIVMKALEERGLSVTDGDLGKRVSQLERQLSARGEGSLASILKKQGITRMAFERKLRSALALEKLARMDLKLPANKQVKQTHMNLWLMDHREKAVVVTDPAKLSPEVAFTVDGRPVTKRRFIADLLPTVKPAVVRKKVIDPLLQQILAERVLKTNQLSLTEADVMREWLDRKKAFEGNPTNKGIKFEDIVHQQTRDTPAAFRSTAGFRVRAALNLMGRKLVTQAALEKGLERYKDIYGPRLDVRHILIKASDNPKAKGRLPTFRQTEDSIRRVYQEVVGGRRFEDAVRLYSEDLGTKYKGGRLPTFTPGDARLDPRFIEETVKLEIDTISKPFKSSFGWHIVRLDRKEPVPPLEEIETDLRRRLAKDLFAEAWRKARMGVDLRL